jgi:hypothetical protein
MCARTGTGVRYGVRSVARPRPGARPGLWTRLGSRVIPRREPGWLNFFGSGCYSTDSSVDTEKNISIRCYITFIIISGNSIWWYENTASVNETTTLIKRLTGYLYTGVRLQEPTSISWVSQCDVERIFHVSYVKRFILAVIKSFIKCILLISAVVSTWLTVS